MIFTDGTWIMGSSELVLHEFARQMDIPARCFADDPCPVYELLGDNHKRALRNGAINIGPETFGRLVMHIYKNNWPFNESVFDDMYALEVKNPKS